MTAEANPTTGGRAPVLDAERGVTESRKMRRLAAASFVGTFIEFYDFGIYGFAAALVFAHAFFPALGDSAGTIASFATLGVAFVARPIGAIIFGHFGDRFGRKHTLLTTLILMGIATVLVGALPTANTIGVTAPILLVVLRILQGLAAGGEWAGAVLFTAESAPPERRGFWAMFAALGGGVAIVVAPLTFLTVELFMGDEAFLSWGWRVPFLFSAVLMILGVWIRLRTEETQAFQAAVAQDGVAKVPIVESVVRQPKEMLLGTGMMIVVSSFAYLGASFLTSYGTTTLHLARTFLLAMGALAGLGYTVAIVIGAVLSDRFGRRRLVLISAGCGVVWGLVLFPIIDSTGHVGYGIGAVGAMVISGIGMGPLGAMLSELFDTRYRYTAAGICYATATIVGGAIAPLVAVSLVASAGGFLVGIMMAGLALISFVCALLVTETRDRALEDHVT